MKFVVFPGLTKMTLPVFNTAHLSSSQFIIMREQVSDKFFEELQTNKNISTSRDSFNFESAMSDIPCVRRPVEVDNVAYHVWCVGTAFGVRGYDKQEVEQAVKNSFGPHGAQAVKNSSQNMMEFAVFPDLTKMTMGIFGAYLSDRQSIIMREEVGNKFHQDLLTKSLISRINDNDFYFKSGGYPALAALDGTYVTTTSVEVDDVEYNVWRVCGSGIHGFRQKMVIKAVRQATRNSSRAESSMLLDTCEECGLPTFF
jgi:hypothetical protein